MKRSPAAAFWLSLLPGAGHVYIGQSNKGVLLIVLAFSLIHAVGRGADAFLIIVFFLWLYSMLDAYRSAQEQNRVLEAGGTLPRGGIDLAKWWGWVLIVLGVLFTLDNFDIISFDWVLDVWPVGLIVLGAYILRNKTIVDSTETATPPPPAGDAAVDTASANDPAPESPGEETR